MLGKWDALYIGAGRMATFLLTSLAVRSSRVWLWKTGLRSRVVQEICKRLGIDGSASPFADVIADLRDYHSTTPGLFLRHGSRTQHRLEEDSRKRVGFVPTTNGGCCFHSI
jgi:hypothetical protein